MTEYDKNTDIDRDETQEWLDALASVVKYEGKARAEFIVNTLLAQAKQEGLSVQAGITTPYINTIPSDKEAQLPDDPALVEKITNCMRWNALVIVLRAGKKYPELGGHLSSFASIVTLYEIGLHYFFRAPSAEHAGDLVYYQGHASPGIYARAFLEGRLEEEHLNHFRQEAFNKKAISSTLILG